jgi:DNA polymerase IV (DinB-like DNA polymerase)
VVTTANYAARKYGIRSALPISRAWRLAQAARRRGEPETLFIRDNRNLYRAVSERVMAYLAESAEAFEEASIDEAYLDFSPLASFEAAVDRARSIKRELAEREGLTCSVGLAPNKLIAKIASDFEKPDGLTVVRPEQIEAFLHPLPIRRLPGIGPKTEAFLHERGIVTLRDLRDVDRPRLVEWFGRWGDDLFDKARGVSETPCATSGRPSRSASRKRSSATPWTRRSSSSGREASFTRCSSGLAARACAAFEPSR